MYFTYGNEYSGAKILTGIKWSQNPLTSAAMTVDLRSKGARMACVVE